MTPLQDRRRARRAPWLALACAAASLAVACQNRDARNDARGPVPVGADARPPDAAPSPRTPAAAQRVPDCGPSSYACREGGACTLVAGQCQVTSAADCARSLRCAALGECSFDATYRLCIVRSAEDCRATRPCREDGVGCRLGQQARRGYGQTTVDRFCHGASDAHCARSAACRSAGLCARQLVEGREVCAATRPEHCAASEYCRVFGACTTQEARCHPLTAADCAGSLRCAQLGLCAPFVSDEGIGMACVAGPREAGPAIDAARLATVHVGELARAVRDALGEPAQIELPSEWDFPAEECEHDLEAPASDRCVVVHRYTTTAGERVALRYSPRGELRAIVRDAPAPVSPNLRAVLHPLGVLLPDGGWIPADPHADE